MENKTSCKDRIVALKYGQTVLSHKHIYPNGDPERYDSISLTVYLIEQDGRRILVDAGCDTMPGFPLSHFVSPCEILARYGLTPQEITDVIITHAHHDHIDAIRHFTNATVYVQEKEYERGKQYLPEHARLHIFDQSCSVTDDVQVFCIGGHSAGSCIVCYTLGEHVYVICGDECYSPNNLLYKIPTGASKNREASKAFIEEYSKPCYIPLLCHDPRILPDTNGYVVLEELR
ncbi:MAG: MBL fold metallo-hydrolase [Ruminococcaceae bacterium]|nr:MBL fold metallo-hydrolase [Oscillospiraceae bacterium]